MATNRHDYAEKRRQGKALKGGKKRREGRRGRGGRERERRGREGG